ncbi:hypothetical protein E4U41_002547 [Claviceps citrina]|nr:hypothetical protein E4U41_002547 [Claviceps citrina]
MLTHRSILNNGLLVAHRMGLVSADRVVVPPPLFHCFGSVLGYMATATTGAAILFPSPAFDPVATLRMCADHDATGLYGVSTMLVALLEALDNSNIFSSCGPPASLRKGIVAGSSVPEALMRTIHRRLGLQDAVICYGMTETSPVSCMTSPSDPLRQRCATVGTPMPHTSIKIVDPADRSVVVPLDTPGELAAAGYLVMKGYLNDAEQTARVRVSEPKYSGSGSSNNSSSPHDDDEATTTWLYSGDEASMDKDGFVTITGRIKDVIIRGGENIHPLEIENCLFQLPGVSQASVVGVPDAKLGETIAAFVIPHHGWGTPPSPSPPADHDTAAAAAAAAAPAPAPAPPDDDDEAAFVVEQRAPAHGDSTGTGTSTSTSSKVLTVPAVQDWVRTHLSHHLVPKHVFWVDDFPKTASGKVQKFRLREVAAELVNGTEEETGGGGQEQGTGNRTGRWKE